MPLHDGPAEKLLRNMVHELRQPLGTIEASAYLLNLTLRDADGHANEHVSVIERQVDLAARILNDAAAQLRRLYAQPAETTSRDFTKSETAAVT
jgi:signal transduction histidine kinase